MLEIKDIVKPFNAVKCDCNKTDLSYGEALTDGIGTNCNKCFNYGYLFTCIACKGTASIRHFKFSKQQFTVENYIPKSKCIGCLDEESKLAKQKREKLLFEKRMNAPFNPNP